MQKANPATVSEGASIMLDRFGWKHETMMWFTHLDKKLDLIVPGMGTLQHERIYFAPTIQEMLDVIKEHTAIITTDHVTRCFVYDKDMNQTYVSDQVSHAPDAVAQAWIFLYGKEGKEDAKKSRTSIESSSQEKRITR